MKKSFCMVLLHFIQPVVVCMSQTPIAVSPRIGTVITAEDRAYFGLFPEVDDFKAAWIEKDLTDSASYDIHCLAGSKEAAIQLSKLDLESLSRYIEDYDSLRYAFTRAFGNTQFPPSVRILVEKGLIKEFEYDRSFMVRIVCSCFEMGDVHQGTLLYCDSTTIVVATDTSFAGFLNPAIIPANSLLSFQYSHYAGRTFAEKTAYFTAILALVSIPAVGIGLFSGYLLSSMSRGNRVGPITWDDVSPYVYLFGAMALGISVPTVFDRVYNESFIELDYNRIREDYFEKLEFFQKRQYYRNGLPPELRSIRER